MQETLTNAWFHQLKAATRQLIKKNGGIEASADITSLSKSQIGRCHSDSDTELLPVPAQMRLEAECGEPVVTRVMAGLHGCKLTDPQATASDGACLMRESLELATRANEYQRNAAIAFSDLKVSPVEARKAIADLSAMMEKAADLGRLYAQVLASGKADAPAFRVVAGGED
ncbi:hypothetical protein AAIH46_18025 [Rhizobium sp. 0TCS1.26]|uniref:hypothetical protein n=1 Tax=Rhizobium sp. 0TCS1.26 TaxID=3142623 RepID=UPI003D2DF19E